MRKRPFGRAGFEVSELTLGTWGLSGDAYGPVYHKEVDKVIDRAIEAGITLFETADVYSYGEMESKLGERLKDAEGTRIVTKIGTFRPPKPPPPAPITPVTAEDDDAQVHVGSDGAPPASKAAEANRAHASKNTAVDSRPIKRAVCVGWSGSRPTPLS